MNKNQQLVLQFYQQMVLCFDQLSPTDKSELAEFEKKRPTSEWPGWSRYVRKTA